MTTAEITFPVTAREVGVYLFDDLVNLCQHYEDFCRDNPKPATIAVPWKKYRRAISKAREALQKPSIGSSPGVLPDSVLIRLTFKGYELVPSSKEQ